MKLAMIAGMFASMAAAQPAPPSIAPLGPPIEMLRADFLAKSGSTRVYFAESGFGLNAQAQATLTAQAQWLLANPFVQVRIEGHGSSTDSRDQAFAIGERRAAAVRQFLILQGVPSAQLTTLSWGKERPVTASADPNVQGLNRRVETVLLR